MTSLRNIALILAIALTATAASAQRLSERDVQKGLTEMRNFKHRLLIKELDLSKEQQKQFFDLYDAMDDELMAVAEETRELERRTLADDKATDTECYAAARGLFDQKKREADIETAYFTRFAEVLTPRQLLRIKPTERKITMLLAGYHSRARQQRQAK